MTGRVRLSQILKVFGWIGLTSLGGGRSVYFHDGLVEKRRWLTNHEFIQDLTLSQLLPGPNYSNLAVALGVRLAGWRGGLCGAVALIVPGALTGTSPRYRTSATAPPSTHRAPGETSIPRKRRPSG